MEVLRWSYRVPFVSTPPLSPALIPLQLFSNFHRAESSAGGDRGFNRQRGSRAGPSYLQGTTVAVCSAEGIGFVEACHRFVGFQQIHQTDEVQDGVK